MAQLQNNANFHLKSRPSLSCGYHGDFATGWNENFLQDAVNVCTNSSGMISDCPLFTLQNDTSAAQCQFPMPSVLEDDHCSDLRDGLCGGVAIQSGPAYASKPTLGLSIVPNSTMESASATPTTLSYTPGTSVATDNSGGGITVAEYRPAVTQVPQTPSPTPSRNGDPNAVSTMTYTSGKAEWDVYIEVTWTTNVVTIASPLKRRRTAMHRRQGHHAGIGGVF